MRSKFVPVLVSVAAVAVALVAATAGSAAAGSRTGPVTAHASKYGKVLFDGRGRSLYLFARDKRGQSSCYGACAKAWPPLLAAGQPKAGPGVRGSLLGTVKRRDGSRQVTYAGHPLYGFANDVKRGQITCQNVAQFGAKWLVVTPAGKAVR